MSSIICSLSNKNLHCIQRDFGECPRHDNVWSTCKNATKTLACDSPWCHSNATVSTKGNLEYMSPAFLSSGDHLFWSVWSWLPWHLLASTSGSVSLRVSIFWHRMTHVICALSASEKIMSKILFSRVECADCEGFSIKKALFPSVHFL